MLKDPALKLDIDKEKSKSNQFRIYHDMYQPRDANGRRKRTHCYYLCDPDSKECINSPPLGKVWYDTIPELIDEIQALECASWNKEQRELPTDMIDIVS